MAIVRKTSKRWVCAECGEKYVSPIPVSEVQHACKKTMPPKTQRKGMLPE
jgi:hypothetical protein